MHREQVFFFVAVAATSRTARSIAEPVINREEDDRAHRGYENAVQVESRHPSSAEEVEQQPADEGTHDAYNDIDDDSLAAVGNDFATDEARDETEDEPSDDRHRTS